MTHTIGRLAQASGVHVETVRYYQRRGLLREPPRPFGGIRRYSEQDVRRLRFIKQAQAMGFSLEEVANLLTLEDGSHCHEAQALGQQKLKLVHERIQSLRRIELALRSLLADCKENDSPVHCPLIGALLDDMPEALKPLVETPFPR